VLEQSFLGDVMVTKQKSEWISVNTSPKKDGRYLIYAPSLDKNKGLIAMAWYDPIGWSLLPSAWINAITHWMPLPTPPKVKRKE
jgi:hypothetical protein